MVSSNIAKHLRVDYELTILICDTHARINGVEMNKSENYIQGVINSICKKSWEIIELSSFPSQMHTSTDINVGYDYLNEISVKARIDLEKSASKYVKCGNIRKGLLRYVNTRLAEKKWIADQFPRSFHLTSANPAIEFLQPDLPTFWLWVTKRGKTTKPWFKQIAEKN